MEGHHERNDDDENQRREPQGLFDPDVVVVLLGELAKPPDGCDGWAGDVAQADARRLIDRFGPDLVRRALKFNRARVARGRFNRARHSFRGAVVRYCEAAQRGEPWADDRAEAQARDARRRAAAEASARRQANAAQREADALAEAEARDELLWSQLDPAQRASMHQAVVGRFPHLARLGQDSPLIRRQIVAELRRTAAG